MAADSAPTPGGVGGPPAPLSLRERKKIKTRAAIRRAAYQLLDEQPWESTTTEQIAAAAEVSPSTVGRYFPVKEDILLSGDDDDLWEARLRARPVDEDPLESLRAVVSEAVSAALTDGSRESLTRARLLVDIPAVRARLTETTAETAQRLAGAVADRTGRDADDLEVRVFCAAALGALREATVYWAEHGQRPQELNRLLHRTVDTLKGGLALRALP
ncbi:TetR/AcrR family transcriptional regulator [Streptomyces sp. NPDC003035]|uniref:TetR/AcrR family transcriptional regulator n=1 Tax=unclassified Streptomyces TaxID=2593676 RepID=UPI0033AD0D4A